MSTDRNLKLQRKTNRKHEKYKYFVGSTLENSIGYKTGDRIVFRIRPRFMNEYLDVPFVKYTLTVENGRDSEGCISASEDGWFYIETKLEKPGFAYVCARACDENGAFINDIEAFNGSAGADICRIKRGTKKPSDYAEFWESMKRAVDSVEPEVIYSERLEAKDYPDFTAYCMRIKVPGSEYASFTVTYPIDAKPGTLKLSMLFQGYGVGPVVPIFKEGYLSVHVCAHAMPNDREPEFYGQLEKGALRDYGYIDEENKKPETTYWKEMLLRDMAVLKFFEKHELLNGRDYYFIGSSQGGMQACNVAAHFGRATGVLLNVPWLSDIYGHELCGYRKNTMPKGEGVCYFETGIAAELLECPVYIISGLGDYTCNSSTQMALYNAISSPKYIELYQNKIHSLTIPWDNAVYSLGEETLIEHFKDHTGAYYDWN